MKRSVAPLCRKSPDLCTPGPWGFAIGMLQPASKVWMIPLPTKCLGSSPDRSHIECSQPPNLRLSFQVAGLVLYPSVWTCPLLKARRVIEAI